MPAAPYGNNFSQTAALELAGKCHVLSIGDSQSTGVLDYLWHDTWPRAAKVQYHYYIIPGTNSGQSNGNNFGYNPYDVATVDACLARTEQGYIYSNTLATNSTANPTVCIASANHGLVTGDTVTIAGQSGTVSINGARVVTVPGGTITNISTASPAVITTSASHNLAVGDVVCIQGSNSGVSIDNSAATVASTPTGTTFTCTAVNNTGAVGSSGQVHANKKFTVPVDCTGGGGTGGTITFNVSSYCMGPVRLNRFGFDISADSLSTASGMCLVRQLSPASHANSSRQAAWPTFPANSSQPWFHGTYMKAKLVLWKDSATLDKFGIYLLRQGTSANNSNLATRVQVDVSAASTGPVASAWTDTLVDAANYDNGASGILNDHECSIRMYSSTAAYSEAGKTLIPLSSIYARCNSGGTIPWNSDNSGAGYDAIGRAGAYVSDWLNFCTQAHWQAYFTATVLVPNAVTKVRIMLGHNMSPSGIDVSDGDGSQVEQSGNLTTSYWKKRYKTLIARIQAAYVAAFPTGQLFIELIVPWVSVQTSATSTATLAADINNVVKAIANETGCSWFSFYDYWGGVAPFWTLHAWTPANGQILAAALRDGMDRATNYAYADKGLFVSPATRNRSWR